MVNYDAPLYQHPQEVWDVKKCTKLAKRVAKDGMGTPYPSKGYLLGELGHHAHGMRGRKFGLLLLTIVILVLAERISQFHEETPRVLFENILGAFIMWLIVLLLGWRD